MPILVNSYGLALLANPNEICVFPSQKCQIRHSDKNKVLPVIELSELFIPLITSNKLIHNFISLLVWIKRGSLVLCKVNYGWLSILSQNIAN